MPPSKSIQHLSVVYDGDYITLRNKAWGGTTIAHSTANQTVRGFKNKTTKVTTYEPANDFSFVIRRVEFNATLKCFVLPPLPQMSDRKAIMRDDYLIFISANSTDYAMGTRRPPPAGNNGDYRVGLYHFPIVTNNYLNNTPIGERAKRFISFGYWNNERNGIDFMAQATCIWTFHSVSVDNNIGMRYGGTPINIRNIWTELKAKEASIWDSGSPLALLIQSTFNGGRNLTMAAGSGGSTVKLALHNKNTDDKAGWIIDAWKGNDYPVYRWKDKEKETAPADDPPPPPAPIVIPGMTPLIRPDVDAPPPNTTYDPLTNSWLQTGLERLTSMQDLRSWMNKTFTSVFGVDWNDLSYITQLVIMLGGIVAAIYAIKTIAEYYL